MASIRARRRRYQALLSFRGEDTRDNFVSHLYKRMTDKGIYTFKDDRILEIGTSIPLALKEAIRDSELHVVVLSKNYASSSWCLNELVEIFDQGRSRGERNRAIVPVFYKVDPSAVRNQQGPFAKAFQSHERSFEVKTVERWRECLREVANMCGWDSRNRVEADFISDIVRDILDKVNCSASIDASDLVGMSSHCEKLLSLLSVDSNDVRMVGIWGMGGIGKSTIARVVYDRIYHKYGGGYYFENVGSKFEKRGATYLRKELLRSILREKHIIGLPMDKYSNVIKERLCTRKVLIVLDDVDQLEQLQVLAKDTSWFGPGSRIIITTRDRQLLVSHGVESVYETKTLETDVALQLFSRFAFKKNQPPNDYLVLSHDLVTIAGCVPLALKVLGSSLCNRNICEWHREIDKLRKIPNWDILKVLKVSYDGLDDMEKDVFLDIACFFNGMNKDKVRNILDGCGFFSERAFYLLMDKSLLSMSDNNLYMHELLRQLGREIVRRECKEPGQRTRWWDPDDIYHCLTKNMGTKSVEGIFLDMSDSKGMQLGSKAFKRMSSLRLLKFHCSEQMEHASNVKFLDASLHSLSNRLRYIHWDAFPVKSLPRDFCAEFLVELHLPYSNVELLWKGKQHLANLKLVDANHSELTRLPDLSEAQKLENLNLQNCKRLVDVSSIGHLSKLEYLNLRGCTSLVTVPSMEDLECLTTVDLSHCSNLRELHQLSRSTKYMYLAGTSIEELPPSIEFLSGLLVLDLTNCRRLKNLQSGSKLKSLRILGVAGCFILLNAILPVIMRLSERKNSSFAGIPIMDTEDDDAPGQFDSLGEFIPIVPRHTRTGNKTEGLALPTVASQVGNDLYFHNRHRQPVAVDSTETTIRKLLEEMVPEFLKPKCVQELGNIRKLLTPWDIGSVLRQIGEVQDILQRTCSITKTDLNQDALTSILGITMLKVRNSFRIQASKSLLHILQADCLVEFHLPYYYHQELWAGKAPLGNLRLINLRNSSKLISLPDLSDARKIVHLNLRGCIKLDQVSHIENLSKLEELDLKNCKNISFLPCMIGMGNLRALNLSGCSNLLWLPPSIGALNSLAVLDLRNCSQLCELPRILRSLQSLNISGCTNILKSLGMKGNGGSHQSYRRFSSSNIGEYGHSSMKKRASQSGEEAAAHEQMATSSFRGLFYKFMDLWHCGTR